MRSKRVSSLCRVSLKLRLHTAFPGGYQSCLSECWDQAAGIAEKLENLPGQHYTKNLVSTWLLEVSPENLVP